MEEGNIPIFSTQYFFQLAFFIQLNIHGYCLLEKHENFQKRSLRNRTYLNNNAKPVILSVPLTKGKNAQSPITSTKISYDSNWQREHLHTMQTIYGKSPFIHFYIEEISWVLRQEFKNLWDLNTSILHWLIKTLQIECKIKETESYVINHDLDFREKNSASFEELNKKLSNTHIYPYIGSSKYSNWTDLSVLDLLFQRGPEAIYIIDFLSKKASV